MPNGKPFNVNAPGGGTVTFYLDYKSPNSDALVAATKAILNNAAAAAAHVAHILVDDKRVAIAPGWLRARRSSPEIGG